MTAWMKWMRNRKKLFEKARSKFFWVGFLDFGCQNLKAKIF